MVRRVIAASVAILAMSSFTLVAPAVAQQAATPAPSKAEALPSGYHLVLLVADAKGGGGTPAEGMTPAVAKALKDAQQFLPFKSYRMMDSAIIRGFAGGTTRLQGTEALTYLVTLEAKGWPNTSVRVTEESYYEKRADILSASFRMAAGETVVAGTSRQRGGEALVVLVTALTEGK